MGNSSSNQINDNVEISKEEYEKYIKYKNAKKKQENNNIRQKKNNVSPINDNHQSHNSSNVNLSNQNLDNLHYNQHMNQQIGKSTINNKIRDYQINNETAFKSQFGVGRVEEDNNDINSTYLPRMKTEFNSGKDSINNFEKKVQSLSNNRLQDFSQQNSKNYDNNNFQQQNSMNYNNNLYINEEGYQYNTSKNNGNYKNTKTQDIDYDKLDPFNILEKKKISLEDLKYVYKKLSIIHHPDKGGDISNFNKLREAYDYIEETINMRINDKTHLELKNNYNEELNNEQKKMNINMQEISSKDNFNINKFNSIYQETRLYNPNDEGYSDIMDKSSKNRDDIDIKNNVGKFTKDKFKRTFDNEKKKNNNNSVVKYTAPEPVSIGKIGFSELGEGSLSNYTSINNGIVLTDYKEAHINNNMIDPNNYKYKKYSNVEDLEKDREILEMSDEQIREIEMKEDIEKKREWERINRLKEKDLQISKNYNKIHNLYLNR